MSQFNDIFERMQREGQIYTEELSFGQPGWKVDVGKILEQDNAFVRARVSKAIYHLSGFAVAYPEVQRRPDIKNRILEIITFKEVADGKPGTLTTALFEGRDVARSWLSNSKATNRDGRNQYNRVLGFSGRHSMRPSSHGERHGRF